MVFRALRIYVPNLYVLGALVLVVVVQVWDKQCDYCMRPLRPIF